jgi:methyl coenzyme M reductase beta subunit
MNTEERIDKLSCTDSIILETIDNFLKRGEIGHKKYGVTMDRNDLDIVEWIDHAIEEQMDNILYLTKIKKCIMEQRQP